MMTKDRLHIELTSKCALKCHACPRTLFASEVHAQDLPLYILEKIIASAKTYSSVLLCGNHGDPIYHSQFHQVLKRLHSMQGEPAIVIATNGSHRSLEWWSETAYLLRPQDKVIFGIDGLQSTNAIYRKGANWDSIETAVKTLRRQSECQIVWQWILFAYNQHQMKLAAKKAYEWQVDQFVITQSFRQHDIGFEPTHSLNEAKEEFLHV